MLVWQRYIKYRYKKRDCRGKCSLLFLRDKLFCLSDFCNFHKLKVRIYKSITMKNIQIKYFF